ncbi:MAG: trypsin-like peptidase domain-containing protein [Flavobacteriales bacterium]
MLIDRSIPIHLLFLIGGMLACSTLADAQISRGGRPLGDKVDPMRATVPFVQMPPVDEEKLLRADSSSGNKKVLRFAKNHDTSIDLKEKGRVTREARGKEIWRLGVHSEGASSLSFGFHPYELAEGAKLFLYTPDQEQILGSFTRSNRSPGSRLATAPIGGERVIIELVEPEGGNSQIGIERVSHGYRNIFGKEGNGQRGYGDAGSCNMNVNCPDGKPWRKQKRAVAMVIDNGSRLCSGALVNNTAEDGTPYFLTADHCLENGGPPSGWVFVFDYEAPNCPDQVATTDQSVSGATLKARHSDSDFGLVELVDTPPTAYEVFYAGWDHSGNTPDSSVCIHHPNGDIKKISFDDDAAVSAQFGNSIANGEWKVEAWDRNTTTETGSSGGPLFNSDKRIVGQLHGGQAQCGNSGNDYFGKFSVSWDYHPASDSQLQYWLDPIDTNQTSWAGYDPLVGNYPNNAALTGLLHPSDALCNDGVFQSKVEFQNRGSQPLDSLKLYLILEQDTLEKVQWEGSLASGAYDTLVFSQHSSSNSGTLRLVVGTKSPNGQSDPEPSDDTLVREIRHPAKGRDIEMELSTDCYGSETEWELKNDQGEILYSRRYGFYPGESSDPDSGGTQWTHPFCLQEGCYELLIRDDYGDGMNGSQFSQCSVDGSLRIIGEEGQLLTELGDPDFGNDTTLEFCTDSSLVGPSSNDKKLLIHPNPAPGHFELTFFGDAGSYTLWLHDMRGKRVFKRRIEHRGRVFNGRVQLPNLRSGIYIMKLNGPFGEYRRKVFIDR